MVDPKKDPDLKLVTLLQLLIAVALFGAMMLSLMRGCGREEPGKIIETRTTTTVTNTATITVTSTSTSPWTSTATTTATATQTATGTSTSTSTAKDCAAVVTFDELQPVIATNCAGCHPQRDTYGVAKSVAAEMARRVALQPGEAGFMPLRKDRLPDDQVALFAKWVADGALKAGECVGGGGGGRPWPPAFQTQADVENAAFRDVSSAAEADQGNYVYLTFTDRIDAGAGVDELAASKAAAAKMVNSVSLERALYTPVEVSPGVLRIDLQELGLNNTKWRLVEDASLLQLESNTGRGRALKELTGKRLPVMPVAEFIDTVSRNAAVYRRLIDLPDTFQEFTRRIGVDFAGDLLNRRSGTYLLAFNGSQLSPAANRQMSRHVSADGAMHCTYDTGPIVSDDQNVFKNPLRPEAGGQANLKEAASECIFHLPNGMLGFWLSNAAGRRLDFADPNVVHDFTTNPLSPIIRNSVSCFQCHAPGLLGAKDEVGPRGSCNTLTARDAQICKALYKPQAVVDQLMRRDNELYGAAAGRIGNDTTLPDPLTRSVYHWLGDLTLADVAGVYGRTEAEMRECIELSTDGRNEAGQLLRGGTLSHDQFLQVKDALEDDCLLLEDALVAP